MALVVWFTVGLALWHFTVFLPDRFWAGIVGALLGAVAGAMLSGGIAQIASGRTIGDTDFGNPHRPRRDLRPRRAPGAPGQQRLAGLGVNRGLDRRRIEERLPVPSWPVRSLARWLLSGRIRRFPRERSRSSPTRTRRRKR
jgi:hypothetical protein